MPRRARIVVGGYPMHVILRDIDRAAIFFDVSDYRFFLERYIELNPVRAGMVEAQADYRWSGYRANALGHADTIIRPHLLYQSLAESNDARYAAYRRLFETELDASLLQRLRECSNGGFVLGNERFAHQIAAMVGRRTWKGPPGRPRKRGGDEGQEQRHPSATRPAI